jgi:hypothetical protein
MLLRRVDVTAHDFTPDTNKRRRRTLGWLRRRGISSVVEKNFFAQPATPFSPLLVQKNAKSLIDRLGYIPGSLYGSATLCDAFWEFLVMTAHLGARDGEVTDAWMINAVDFMIQAVLEAYRCHGCIGVDAVNDCFAVGITPVKDLADQTNEEVVVNDLFAGEDGAVGEEFESQRKDGLQEVSLFLSNLNFVHQTTQSVECKNSLTRCSLALQRAHEISGPR